MPNTMSQYMLQNIQALVAANPSLLTSGIPNKLLTQIMMQAPKQVNQNPILVGLIFILI